MYAPWRTTYNTVAPAAATENKHACPFCTQSTEDSDEKNFILKRFKHCFVMLNRYPYYKGHLLVVPFKHVASLELLEKNALDELMHITAAFVPLLKQALGTVGTNIGMNLGGHFTGGSIPDHLHMHILPRAIGDTGFVTTIADTIVIGANLNDVYTLLKTECEKLILP